MKQKLTFYTLIMILVETICLFIPGCFQTDCWLRHANSNVLTKIIDESQVPINIFMVGKYESGVNIMETGYGWWFSYVVVSVMLLSFVSFLGATLRPKHKLAKYACFAPVVSFAVLIGFTYYACEIAEVNFIMTRCRWEIGWLYYFIIILHILSILFSVLIKFKKLEDIPISFTPKKNHLNINAADELKKYKELLDSGIITQEEFDAKKKQLLGL